MHSKVVAGDKTVRKKLLKCASKIKTSIAESEKTKVLSKHTNNLMSKECGIKQSSTDIKKHSTCQISDSKTTLYKNMKKLLETKYKKITLSTSSREKLSPEKSRYDPTVYNLTKAKEKTPFFGSPYKKASSISDSNTVDSRFTLKDEKYLSNQESLTTDAFQNKLEITSQESDLCNHNKIEDINTSTVKSEETPIKKTKSDETTSSGKMLSENKDKKQNKNSTMDQGKSKKFKISKRLASLARPKELPIPVKKDLSFKPFKVPKRALLFRDSSRVVKSGTDEKNISQTVKKKGNRKCIVNVFDSNRPHFGHYRKKRRLLKTSKPYFPTPRILELAKPVPKHPPVDILPPDEVFTVKKRSLKAKCSKRISELAFPVMRPEEYRIKAEYPFSTKRRSLRAKCTKRVKELAKPLPRRCRSPIRKVMINYGIED